MSDDPDEGAVEKGRELRDLSNKHAAHHHRRHERRCPDGCEWGDAPAVPESSLVQQMEAVQEVREAVGAIVAALVADGFTDEQARDVVAGFWRTAGRKDDS